MYRSEFSDVQHYDIDVHMTTSVHCDIDVHMDTIQLTHFKKVTKVASK